MTKEIDYYNQGNVFAVEIECRFCGDNNIVLLFNDIDNTLIFKCGNCKCGHQEIINI